MGPGLTQAGSKSNAFLTRRPCCPTAWSWSQGASLLPRPLRNCTIRRAGLGRPRGVSTPHALITRRPCCPTAWSLLQGEIAVAFPRNYILLRQQKKNVCHLLLAL